MRYVKNSFINYLFFITVVLFSQMSVASNLEVQMGAGLTAFNYAEYDDNNVFLDGETGFIPGFILKLKNNNGKSFAEWVTKAHYNVIKYDGHTQSGTPVVTHSDAFIVDTHVKLGQNLARPYGYEQALYFGLGYRYWLRNIRSGYDVYGNPVTGLLEKYHWLYGLVGYTIHFESASNVKSGLDFRLTQMMNAQMDVAFGGYDNATVNLGNKLGVRIAAPVEIKMAQTTLFITPFYEIIDIGKSDTAMLTLDGVPQGFGILEPRSETRNLGIEITWLW